MLKLIALSMAFVGHAGQYWPDWVTPVCPIQIGGSRASYESGFAFFPRQLDSAYGRLDQLARIYADHRRDVRTPLGKAYLNFAYFDAIKGVYSYLEMAHRGLGRMLEEMLRIEVFGNERDAADARRLAQYARRLEQVFNARFNEIFIERQRWNKISITSFEMELKTWDGLPVADATPKYADGLYNPIAEIGAIRTTCEILLDRPLEDVVRAVAGALPR